MSRRDQLFETITTEGALLPSDFLQRLAQRDRDIAGLTSEAYHLGEGEKLNEAISRSWNRLLGVWKNFVSATQALPASDLGTTLTREKWLLPLFQELGYGRLQIAKPFEFDDRRYSISHAWQAAPIHLVSFRADLDERSEAIVGARKSTPHSMVQEFLNRSDAHLWGIVSNSFKLRFLRDNSSLIRQAYVEFDLEAMMQGEIYADFALLWLLLHQSRVEGERPELCWLEKWTQEARHQGERFLDHMRDGVQDAITALGQGFLAHPANTALRDRLRSGELSTQDYFRQLLRVVYRLLFLCIAEDRDLLHPSDVPAKTRENYRRHYSLARLRRMAQRLGGTQHSDLWHIVQLIVRSLSFKGGCPSLGLPALGSFLWSERATPALDGCQLSNRHLLQTIRSLAFSKQGRFRRPVDYKNIGSPEFGSVYESLLEQHPKINLDAATFTLDTHAGNERKTSGSHYTPPPLVNCLLDSALEPILRERERDFAKLGFKSAEEAVLSLKVCDKAVGSGHFLVAAAHRIAKRLASIRTGEEEPAPAAYRHALRDVIGRCLYGVDINPMAVELCKFALWLEALEPGKPLSFLDHHIQCGNSLLGATPELIKGGIPDKAFDPIEGDNKDACYGLKNRNKRENPRLGEWFIADEAVIRDKLFKAAAAINEIGDSLLEEIERKEAAFRNAQTNYDFQKAWDLADLWCAAFVIRKRFPDGAGASANNSSATANDQSSHVQTGLFGGIDQTPNAKGRKVKALSRVESENAIGITTQHLRDYVEGGALLDGLLTEAKRLARQYQFFHWHLAFPDVFQVPPAGQKPENQLCGWNGGFDVLLGNPPWERVKLQEREWFAATRPDIADAATAAIRARMIEQLKQDDPNLHTAFLDAMRQAEGESSFARHSGRFPHGGVGDTNTYPLFIETATNVVAPRGRTGMIVKTGILADFSLREFFSYLVESGRFVSAFDFSNGKLIFPAVVANERFTLLTLAGFEAHTAAIRISILCEDVSDLTNPLQVWELPRSDIALINPNTRTCPLFQTAPDASLVTQVYHRLPVLIREADERNGNPWGVFYLRMFDMTNDSGLFKDLETLQSVATTPPAPKWLTKEGECASLLEGKLFDLFDHKHGTFAGVPREDRFGIKAEPNHPSSDQRGDPFFDCLPRYWIPFEEVRQRYLERLGFMPSGVLSFRDVCRVHTDFRTVRAAICPPVGAGNKAPLLLFPSTQPREHATRSLLLCANLGSFALDYIARQKFSGGSLNRFVLIQFPIVPPTTFAQPCAWAGQQQTLQAWLLPRVLELTYTAWDLEAFARDCGWSGPPFRWDEARRFLLRCELDAAFFHLYGLNRADTAYILDTFPIVKRKDEARFNGDYRTKRVILEIYDALAESQRTGKPYQTLLNPAPASILAAHPPRFDQERVNLEVGDYILGFVFSMLRYSGGISDIMRLVRGYALLQQPQVLASLVEAEFDVSGRKWLEKSSQPHDVRWFLPILRRMETQDMVSFEVRGDDVIVHQKDPQGPRVDAAVGTDAFLVMRVLDIVPDKAVAEPIKRMVPNTPRLALQEAVM